MEHLIFRKASIDDVDSIKDLSDQLGYPSTLNDIRNRLSAISGLEDHSIMVAETEGKVIGWMQINIQLRLELDPFLEITGLVVDSNYRGLGIGEKFLEEAKNWALERKVHHIFVRCSVVRKRTHNFYLNHGFREIKKQKIFYRKLTYKLLALDSP